MQLVGAPHSIHVLALEHDLTSAVTLFVEPRLFHAFGLPLILRNQTRGIVETLIGIAG
ncbi:MAG TPA: hypothetical protein VNO35_35840 [Steroidobacteraceae bacterium]|nr:hypothetical protein [Steroidobacteraceae bacterium]